MSDNRSLFDGADVVGIGWGPQASADNRPTDTAAIRKWAGDIEEAGVPDEVKWDPCGMLRAAADEIDALRAEVMALKKGAATLSRKCAALQRIADGKGLDITVKEQAP